MKSCAIEELVLKFMDITNKEYTFRTRFQSAERALEIISEYCKEPEKIETEEMSELNYSSDWCFLKWIHDRLYYVHDENYNYDYMHRLRAIISAIDPNQSTPCTDTPQILQKSEKIS